MEAQKREPANERSSEPNADATVHRSGLHVRQLADTEILVVSIMSTSKQDEDEFRRQVLRDDLRLRQQQQQQEQTGSTFHQHALADAEIPGRFAAVANAQVVGQSAVPNYLAASSPWQGPDLVGLEPPLSAYDNPTLELTAPPVSQGLTDPTSDDPSPLGRDVGSLSQIDGPATEVLPASASSANAGPSPFRRVR